MGEKVGLVVDPKLFDEVLKPYVDEVLAKDSRNFEMDQMAFGLHESDQYLTLVKDGVVAFEGEPLDTVVPTILTHGIFLGMKYCAARDAQKISTGEEYRAGDIPAGEMTTGHGYLCRCDGCFAEYCRRRGELAAAPPRPHIRRVGKILHEEKSSTGGKPQ